MQIDPVINLAKLTLSPSISGVQNRQWSIGQLLQASVIGRAENGDYTLRIGQQEVRAQSPVALQSGERMALRVIETGQQPVLQRIAPEVALKETINQALRNYLPRQSGLSPLLANLSHLASDGNSPLPPSAVKLANAIFQQLPQAEQLSSPGILRQQVENAALFLESRLAARLMQASAPLPQNNFKASLLRLAALLPQAQSEQGDSSGRVRTDTASQTQTGVSSALFKNPVLLTNSTNLQQQASPLQARLETEPVVKPSLAALSLPDEASRELAKQVESVLSRVVVQQLNTLHSENSGQQQWLVDIPIRQNDIGKLVQLHIQKDQQQQRQAEIESETQWTFSLSIDLDELGPLHARISLSGTRLIANLWAEQEETLGLLTQHTDALDARLINAGLENNEIRCFRGKPDLPVAESSSQESLISQHV